MDTYSLLLVDDEEEVIQVITKKVKWEELGFTVIGYANNGVKALEMIEENQPDVVMTDIRMPYMDGMELCSNIKAKYPAIKVLLFTGFDEFEYAREAVHLEIEEYILKPLNAAELTEVFARLKQKLDQEINEKRNTQVLEKYYMESLPLLQANFFASLIEGRIPEDQFDSYLRDYQIEFSGPYYCCLVIHTSASQVPEDMNAQLLAMSVDRQAQEQLEEKWRAQHFPYLGNMVFLVQLKDEGEVTELTDESDRFCKYAKRIIGATVTVGVGVVCRNPYDLARSYHSAKEAVSYRVLYGGARAININEISPQKRNPEAAGSEDDLTYLFKMISLGTEEDIKKAVDDYLVHMFTSGKSLQKHHVAVMELVSALYRFAANHDLDISDSTGEVGDVYGKLTNMEAPVLGKWLLTLCLSFHEKMADDRSNSTKSLIGKAKEYIHSNYKEEGLSLDDICETLGVSNSYFSSIFKKETGNSFIGYLTEYRMEKAARLLIETNEKSYMIAKSVGYSDPNYFSYVFKRQYGVSPSKYRTEYAKVEE